MKKSYAEFRDQLTVITRICNKLEPEEQCYVLKLVSEVYDIDKGSVFNPPLTHDRGEARMQCRLILNGEVDDENDVLRFIYKVCCARESHEYVTTYASVPEFIDVLKRYAPLLHRGVTKWYPGTVNPVRVGWYETTGFMRCGMRRWDGNDWVGSYGRVDEWRGITQLSHATGEFA